MVLEVLGGQKHLATSLTTMYSPRLHIAVLLLLGVLADGQQNSTASIVHTSQRDASTTLSSDVTSRPTSIHDVTSASTPALSSTSIHDVTSIHQVTTGSDTSVVPEFSSTPSAPAVTGDNTGGSTEAGSFTTSALGGSTDSTQTTDTPTCAPCQPCGGGNVVAAAVPMGIIIGIQFTFIVFLGCKQYRSTKYGFLFEEIR